MLHHVRYFVRQYVCHRVMFALHDREGDETWEPGDVGIESGHFMTKPSDDGISARRIDPEPVI